MTLASSPITNQRQHRLHTLKPTTRFFTRHHQNIRRLDVGQVQREPHRRPRYHPSFTRPLQPMRHRQTNTTLATRHLRRPQRTRSIITIMVNRTSNIRLRRISSNPTNNDLNPLTTIRRRTISSTFNRHHHRNTIKRKRNNHYARRYGNRRGISPCRGGSQ